MKNARSTGVKQSALNALLSHLIVAANNYNLQQVAALLALVVMFAWGWCYE